MSAPMETEQNPTTPTVQNGVASQHSPSSSSLLPEDKVLVPGTLPLSLSLYSIVYILISQLTFNFAFLVEVCLKPSSTASIPDVRLAVEG